MNELRAHCEFCEQICEMGEYTVEDEDPEVNDELIVDARCPDCGGHVGVLRIGFNPLYVIAEGDITLAQ